MMCWTHNLPAKNHFVCGTVFNMEACAHPKAFIPKSFISHDQATARQVSAARTLYSPPDKLDVVRWSEYADELDRIIDDLLGRTNPYFSDDDGN